MMSKSPICDCDTSAEESEKIYREVIDGKGAFFENDTLSATSIAVLQRMLKLGLFDPRLLD
jgi:hypothetical protein